MSQESSLKKWEKVSAYGLRTPQLKHLRQLGVEEMVSRKLLELHHLLAFEIPSHKTAWELRVQTHIHTPQKSFEEITESAQKEIIGIEEDLYFCLQQAMMLGDFISSVKTGRPFRIQEPIENGEDKYVFDATEELFGNIAREVLIALGDPPSEDFSDVEAQNKIDAPIGECPAPNQAINAITRLGIIALDAPKGAQLFSDVAQITQGSQEQLPPFFDSVIGHQELMGDRIPAAKMPAGSFSLSSAHSPESVVATLSRKENGEEIRSIVEPLLVGQNELFGKGPLASAMLLVKEHYEALPHPFSESLLGLLVLASYSYSGKTQAHFLENAEAVPLQVRGLRFDPTLYDFEDTPFLSQEEALETIEPAVQFLSHISPQDFFQLVGEMDTSPRIPLGIGLMRNALDTLEREHTIVSSGVRAMIAEMHTLLDAATVAFEELREKSLNAPVVRVENRTEEPVMEGLPIEELENDEIYKLGYKHGSIQKMADFGERFFELLPTLLAKH